MDVFRNSSRFLPILALLLIMTSCAQIKQTLVPQQPTQTQDQGMQYVKSGEYQKAIDFYEAQYEKHPQDQSLAKEYVNSLEEIKTVAHKSFVKENFASAGRVYNILLKNFANFKDFAHKLSFDRTYINSKIAECKTALSRMGFQAYRDGDLGAATSYWQDYLTIDPNNADIKKALNTTKMQQKNLQQIK